MSDASGETAIRPRKRRASITNINQYDLGKSLGEGSFGKVKLGRDASGGEFAVKIVNKKLLEKGPAAVRMEREIQVLSLLSHPNIAQLFEVIDTDTHKYLVMEYAPGGELFDYIIAHGRVRESRARRFFREIISALSYCHANFVVHRDLKPENLLLDEKGSVKIIDFGFTNTFTPDELLKTWCGSPAYAAPELIRHVEYVGPKADIWSLGVVLYAITCGCLPFDAAETNKVFKKVLRGRYEIPSFLSEGAVDIIGRMLVVDPSDRATLDELFAHPWTIEGHSGPPRTYLPQREAVAEEDLDDAALIDLVVMGFDRAEVIELLKENAPCQQVTTYHLILEKRARIEREAEEKLESLTRRTRSRKRSGSTRSSSRSRGEDELASRLGTIREDAVAGRSKGSSGPRRVGDVASKRTTGRRVVSLDVRASRKQANSGGGDDMAAALAAARSPRDSSADAGPSTSTATDTGSSRPPRSPGLPPLSPGNPSGAGEGTSGGAGAGGEGSSAAPRRRRIQGRPQRRNRRFSLGNTMQSLLKKVKKGQNELAVVDAPFSSASTSSKAPEEISVEVERVLRDMGVPFDVNGFIFSCEHEGIKFDVEICKLKRMQLNALRFVRRNGDSWAFKEICDRILAEAHI